MFKDYAKKYKSISEMESNKKSFEEKALCLFEESELIKGLGIKIVGFKIESFIEN